MDTALIALSATTAIIAVAFVAFTVCRQRTSRDDAEPIVGVQRQGRTYYLPRSAVEGHEARDAWALSAGWRAAIIAVLGGTLLLTGLLRLL